MLLSSWGLESLLLSIPQGEWGMLLLLPNLSFLFSEPSFFPQEFSLLLEEDFR
jgi:hypothetical protein